MEKFLASKPDNPHQEVLKVMINSDIRVNQHQPVDQRDTHH